MGDVGNVGFFTYGPLGALEQSVSELTFLFSTVIPGFDIWSTELTAIHFPNLVSIDPTNVQGGFLHIRGNPFLTTIELPVFVPTPGMSIDLQQNNLSSAVLDQVLARCVANPAFTSGNVLLGNPDHETPPANQAPSLTGSADADTLTARGVNVTLPGV